MSLQRRSFLYRAAGTLAACRGAGPRDLSLVNLRSGTGRPVVSPLAASASPREHDNDRRRYAAHSRVEIRGLTPPRNWSVVLRPVKIHSGHKGRGSRCCRCSPKNLISDPARSRDPSAQVPGHAQRPRRWKGGDNEPTEEQSGGKAPRLGREHLTLVTRGITFDVHSRPTFRGGARTHNGARSSQRG